MDNEEFSNKDLENEVRNVLNKTIDLTRASNKNGWNQIMEQSDKKHRMSNRAQVLSAAAAVAVIAGIAAIILVATSNGGSDGTIKTTNNKVSTSTTSQIVEQDLLKNTLAFNVVPDTELAVGSVSSAIDPNFLDGKTGERLGSIFDHSPGYINNMRLNNNVVFWINDNFCNDGSPTYLNTSTLKVAVSSDLPRFFSPDGKRSVHFDSDCLKDLDDPFGSPLTLDNGKKFSTLKNSDGTVEVVTDVMWANNSTLLLHMAKFNPNDPSENLSRVCTAYKTLDINDSSLVDAKEVKGLIRNCGSVSDEKWTDIYDSIVDGGKTYLLGQTTEYKNNTYNYTMQAIELSTGKAKWSVDVPSANGVGFAIGEFAVFGKTSDVVYGSLSMDLSRTAFVYNNVSGKTLFPNAAVILPIR